LPYFSLRLRLAASGQYLVGAVSYGSEEQRVLDVVGTIIREAVREGKVLYERAA
jgi:hypothetical protein